MPDGGFASMIRSTCAHPRAERRTRNRPEITATDAPSDAHAAMAALTVSGVSVETRRSPSPSAESAFTFDRAEIQVAGRHS